MFRFGKDQITYEIGGVKVGGEVGDNPTVMIGTLFYRNDKTIEDEKSGRINHEKATQIIRQVEEISAKTGLQAMLDIVCTNELTAEKYIEFAANATRMPLVIDAVSAEAAIAGLNQARRLQILDRTVLNSVNPETKEVVLEKIKEVGLKSGIALTYSSKALFSYKERIRLLETLVPKMEKVGIKNILIDTAVLDIPTLGLACRAVQEIKHNFGYPVGCGAHNAIESWGALKKINDKILTWCSAAIVNGYPVAIGADLLFYGPLSAAKYIFPVIGLINAANGQIRMEDGKRPNANHPRFRIPRFQ